MLESLLGAGLGPLNPVLPPEAITAAVDDLTRDRPAMSLEAANREAYRLLKEACIAGILGAEADFAARAGRNCRK